jgi:ribonuclease J
MPNEKKAEVAKNKGKMVWESIGGNNPETIGGNCDSFTYVDEKGKASAILTDLGSLFCDEEATGLSSIVPDARKFLNKADGSEKADVKAEALIITHGHMDHTGGIPHLIKMGYELPPIYGSKVAIEYIKSQLASQRVPWQGKTRKDRKSGKEFTYSSKKWPTFVEVEPGQEVKIGEFNITPLSVTHSIPGANAYKIASPASTVIHTGDMKTDKSVKIGATYDTEAFQKAGAEGIDAVFADSTSIMNPEKATPEATVLDNIKAEIANEKGRKVVCAVIASSTQRLASVAEAARDSGRALIAEGSSLVNSMRVLKKAGHDLKEIVPGLETVGGNTKKAAEMADGDKLVACTGTQGEVVAALAKAINQEYTPFSVDEEGKKHGRENPFLVDNNTTIVMTQGPIPGNEESYFSILEKAVKECGAKVVVPTKPEDKELAKLFSYAQTHTSGHGGRGDILEMYGDVKKNAPKGKKMVAVPVHGSQEHFDIHTKVAQEAGYEVHIQQNYEALEITTKGVKPAAVVVKDGKAEVKAANDNRQGDGHWIGAENSVGDWRKPFYNYYEIDKDYKRTSTIQKDAGPRTDPKKAKIEAKKNLIKANKNRYRKNKEANKAVMVKKFWQDMDR